MPSEVTVLFDARSLSYPAAVFQKTVGSQNRYTILEPLARIRVICIPNPKWRKLKMNFKAIMHFLFFRSLQKSSCLLTNKRRSLKNLVWSIDGCSTGAVALFAVTSRENCTALRKSIRFPMQWRATGFRGPPISNWKHGSKLTKKQTYQEWELTILGWD